MAKATKTTAATNQTRVWILARTSSDDRGEVGQGRESVPVQIEACKNYAHHHDWDVVPDPVDFADQDRSGRTYPTGEDADKMVALDLATTNYLAAHRIRDGKSRRQGLGKILAGIQRGDVLLVRDLTRLARPVPYSMLAAWLRQQLQVKGVRLVSVVEGEQDFRNLAQRLMSDVSDTINDAAITKQVAQSKASLQTKRDNGFLFACPTCYGYRSVGKQKTEQVPAQIVVVQRIFKEVLVGTSVLGICRNLNADKVPTFKGKQWQVRTLRSLLQRPAYAGLQRDTLGRLVESKAFSPCVPAKAWHTAQKVFRQYGKREDKRIHPLSGLVVCGHCGKKMVICRSRAFDTDEEQWYYRCQGAHETGAQGCRDTLIRATMTSRVEGVGGLVECLKPLCIVGLVEAEKRRELQPETVRQADECRVELVTIADRETAAFEERQKGTLDDAQYEGIMARLRARRAAAARSLAEAEKAISVADEKADGGATFIATLRADQQFELPPLDFRDAVRAIVERVEVHKDSILLQLVPGGECRLPRLHIRNSRPLPLPCGVSESAATGQLCVTYATRRAGDRERIVYDSDVLRVVLLGTSPPLAEDADIRVVPGCSSK